jgi:hypothetical protein
VPQLFLAEVRLREAAGLAAVVLRAVVVRLAAAGAFAAVVPLAAVVLFAAAGLAADVRFAAVALDEREAVERAGFAAGLGLALVDLAADFADDVVALAASLALAAVALAASFAFAAVAFAAVVAFAVVDFEAVLRLLVAAGFAALARGLGFAAAVLRLAAVAGLLAVLRDDADVVLRAAVLLAGGKSFSSPMIPKLRTYPPRGSIDNSPALRGRSEVEGHRHGLPPDHPRRPRLRVLSRRR